MRKRTRLGKGASWNKCSSTLASSTVYSSISSATIATSIISLSLSLSLHLLFTFYFYFYFFPKWWWRWFQLAFLTKAYKLSLKYMYMCMCIYIKGKLPSNLGGCFTLTTYHLPLTTCLQFQCASTHPLASSFSPPTPCHLFFFFFFNFHSPYSLYDNDMLPFRFISFIHFCCVSFRTCSLFHPMYAFPFLA